MQGTALEATTTRELGRLATLVHQSSESWERCAEYVRELPGIWGVCKELSRQRAFQANALEAMLADEEATVPRQAAQAEGDEIWRTLCEVLRQEPRPGGVVVAAEQAERRLLAAVFDVLSDVSTPEPGRVLWRFYSRIKADLQRIHLWTCYYGQAEQTEHLERRSEARYAANLAVNVTEPSHGMLAGRTLDVSPSGLKLELARKLQVGSDVTLHLALAERTLRIAGRVRAAEPSGPGTFRHGVEFLIMNVDDRESLEAFLLGYKAAEARQDS